MLRFRFPVTATWREFFKDLKVRGLDGQHVVLGIMDGLPGLEKVFREEFPGAKVQRCQVHVTRNVLAKVPKKSKQQVADYMRSVFFTLLPTVCEQMEYDSAFGRYLPGQIYRFLYSFFDFPEEEWIALRTTNIIERLNKKFKRRTKPMEIVA